MGYMLPALQNALPHLQPPKRVRGKVAAENADGSSQPPRRRRCRVSDEEAEQLRLKRLALPARGTPLDQTVIVAHPAASHGIASFVDPTA